MKLRQVIKKADILLLICLLALGLASVLLVRSGGSSGSTVVISVDGKKYGSYPLTVDKVIDVDTKYGHNQVTISGGTVSVTESDCPNHDCQNFGAISLPRQSIICIPHRLSVTVTGESDVDIVVY